MHTHFLLTSLLFPWDTCFSHSFLFPSFPFSFAHDSAVFPKREPCDYRGRCVTGQMLFVSPKWPILCRVERKTSAQSIKQPWSNVAAHVMRCQVLYSVSSLHWLLCSTVFLLYTVVTGALFCTTASISASTPFISHTHASDFRSKSSSWIKDTTLCYFCACWCLSRFQNLFTVHHWGCAAKLVASTYHPDIPVHFLLVQLY